MEQLIIENKYAGVHQRDSGGMVFCDGNPETGCLRIYRNSPGFIEIQIRAYSKLNQWSKTAKPRNLLANVSINADQALKLIEKLQEALADL